MPTSWAQIHLTYFSYEFIYEVDLYEFMYMNHRTDDRPCWKTWLQLHICSTQKQDNSINLNTFQPVRHSIFFQYRFQMSWEHTLANTAVPLKAKSTTSMNIQISASMQY